MRNLLLFGEDIIGLDLVKKFIKNICGDTRFFNHTSLQGLKGEHNIIICQGMPNEGIIKGITEAIDINGIIVLHTDPLNYITKLMKKNMLMSSEGKYINQVFNVSDIITASSNAVNNLQLGINTHYVNYNHINTEQEVVPLFDAIIKILDITTERALDDSSLLFYSVENKPTIIGGYYSKFDSFNDLFTPYEEELNTMGGFYGTKTPLGGFDGK